MKISGAKGLVFKKAFSVFSFLVLYRLLALGIAIVQISLNNPAEPYFPIPTTTIIILASVYTLLIILFALKPLRQRHGLGYIYISVDILACISLVFLTGGISSPFLLYTLSPILTAALFLRGSITIVIATLSLVYVISSHLANPFFPTQLLLPELSYFTVYIIAVALTAVLPYMININLRQRLHSESIINERQRLSRELHDGVVQTLTMLRWRIQLFKNRFITSLTDFEELNQLEKLVEKARYDASEALDLLHHTTYKGRFMSDLRESLEGLRNANGINIKIKNDCKDIPLDNMAKTEILRICQEALANIRRHSDAKNVCINIGTKNNRFLLSITDDGHGFDPTANNKDNLSSNGYGLTVMQERAELLNGKLQVVSAPGQGTVVQVEIPLKFDGGRVLWQKK